MTAPQLQTERAIFIDNLLVRLHFIIVMIRWTGLAPWEFEYPFPGSLISTFLSAAHKREPISQPIHAALVACGTREACDWSGFVKPNKKIHRL